MPRSSPTSPGAASSTSAHGTGSSRSLPRRPVRGRVVALDHYAWGVDFVARGAYWEECIHNGPSPDQSRDETDFWRPDLPGQRGFDLAKAALGPRSNRWWPTSRSRPGRARAVRRRPLSRRAVPHEGAADLPRAGARRDQGGGGHRDRGPAPPAPRRRGAAAVPRRSSLRTDFGNWYVPTIEALHNLCRPPASRDRARRRPPRPAGAAAGAEGALGRRSPAPRHRRRRRPARTTAPSSTRSCEPRRGVSLSPSGPAEASLSERGVTGSAGGQPDATSAATGRGRAFADSGLLEDLPSRVFLRGIFHLLFGREPDLGDNGAYVKELESGALSPRQLVEWLVDSRSGVTPRR